MFSVELTKKTQERSGHLAWRLLLNPVAFTVNNGGASKVCAVRSRPSVEVNARYKRPHWIERPSDEGTGLMNLKPGQLGKELPVSSLCAVSVEWATKTTPFECSGEVVEVRFRHP